MLIQSREPWRSTTLALLATISIVVPMPTTDAQAAIRDWALFKTVYHGGSFVFMPIVGIGGVPVAIGAVQNESRPFLHYYIDRNSYRRTGDTISFDLVMQMTIHQWSRLHANVTVDCAVRTFLMPTFQTFEGPLATGGPKTKEKSYMKKPKVYGDLKAEDLAYFCEGASPAPISLTSPRFFVAV